MAHTQARASAATRSLARSNCDLMSYQTTIDLNYSALINFSENEFTQAWPGTLHGIKKVFQDLGRLHPAEIVLWMTERQGDEIGRLGLPFAGLWGASCT
jgi:hypothetical protein